MTEMVKMTRKQVIEIIDPAHRSDTKIRCSTEGNIRVDRLLWDYLPAQERARKAGYDMHVQRLGASRFWCWFTQEHQS